MAERVLTFPPGFTLCPVLLTVKGSSSQQGLLVAAEGAGQGNLVACCKAFVWSEGLAGSSRLVWGGAGAPYPEP